MDNARREEIWQITLASWTSPSSDHVGLQGQQGEHRPGEGVSGKRKELTLRIRRGRGGQCLLGTQWKVRSLLKEEENGGAGKRTLTSEKEG